MKPGFSLLFSMDGVSLLQRVAGGWHRVGSVAMGDDDPGPALAALRAKGETLGHAPLACKLVIPNEQVRYLSTTSEETGADERLAAAQQALEAATPYALDELAFDLCADGPNTHIAAVTIETLAEAEAFAAEAGFLPVSFVAAPGTNAFVGEPFFGTARAIRGTEVEPDGVAVVVTGDTEPADISALGPDNAVKAANSTETGDSPDQPNPSAGNASEAAADPLAEPDKAPPQQEPDPVEDHVEQVRPPQPLSDRSTTTEPAQDAAPSSDGNSSQAALSAAKAASPDSGQDIRKADAGSEPAAPEVPGTISVPQKDSRTPPAALPEQATLKAAATSIPPVPKAPPRTPPEKSASFPDAPLVAEVPQSGFASRRRKQDGLSATKAAALPGTDASAAAAASLKPVGRDARPPVKPQSGAKSAISATLPSSPPPLTTKAASVPAASSALPPRPKATAQAAAAKPPAGRRRTLGLAMVGGLLLALAALAVVSLRSTETPVSAEIPGPEKQTVQADEASGATSLELQTAGAAADLQNSVATLPEPEAELLADLEHSPGMDDPGSIASTLPSVLPLPKLEEALQPSELITSALPSAEELQTAPAEEVPLDTAPAQAELSQAALYAATGVWQTAPERPDAPEPIDLDSIYFASIDHTGLSQDAIALPSAATMQTDSIPDTQSSPAAAGSTFVLDERGLVEATPDGTLNPDGIMIYLGKPAKVPPATPDRPDLEAEAAAEAAARQLLLAQSRPRPRPDDLVEQAERARLGGLSRSELAGKRPRARPASLKTAAQESQPPTAQALAVSTIPRRRPSNFANIVDRARKNTSAQPVTTVAAAAPATVTPSLPTSASVARQATQENALNLRKINLIGVFGTSSDRRALVRLASGGYRNVQIGDRLDGGRVVAIGDSQLRYEKNGRNLTLKIPNG